MMIAMMIIIVIMVMIMMMVIIVVMIMMMMMTIVMIITICDDYDCFLLFLSTVLLSPEKWIIRWSTPRAIHSTDSGRDPSALFATTKRLNILCISAASEQAS